MSKSQKNGKSVRRPRASFPWCPLILLVACAVLARAEGGPAGTWEGSIRLPTGELAVVVRLAHTDDGWSGEIDIPQQGGYELQLEDVRVEGESVRFSIGGVPGTPVFDGSLVGETLSGPFEQSGQTFSFQLTRTGAGTESPGAGEELSARAIEGFDRLEGDWSGQLESPAGALEIIVSIAEDDRGYVVVEVESADQLPGRKFPVTRLELASDRLSFAVPSWGASFTAERAVEDDTWIGTFTQGVAMPLTLGR